MSEGHRIFPQAETFVHQKVLLCSGIILVRSEKVAPFSIKPLIQSRIFLDDNLSFLFKFDDIGIEVVLNILILGV